jgi:hypothetical protein
MMLIIGFLQKSYYPTSQTVVCGIKERSNNKGFHEDHHLQSQNNNRISKKLSQNEFLLSQHLNLLCQQ